MPRYYPINLLLKDKRCLVIGTGGVAERKARRLLGCGAKVLVIGPEAAPNIIALAKAKKIIYKKRRFHLKDLRGAYLVIAASSDRNINSAAFSYCRKAGILINVVDSPGECDFILPSIVKRGDLTITISTDGLSPALSKKIRLELEKRFGAEYAAFLRMMRKIRPEALKRLKGSRTKKIFFQTALRPGIFDLIKRHKAGEAKRRLEAILDDAA